MAHDSTESVIIEDLEEKLEEERERCHKLRGTLSAVAQRLAEIGLIDSSPYAKRLFIDGEREL